MCFMGRDFTPVRMGRVNEVVGCLKMELQITDHLFSSLKIKFLIGDTKNSYKQLRQLIVFVGVACFNWGLLFSFDILGS